MGGFACYQHQYLHLNNLQHPLLLGSFRNDLAIPLSTMSCWVITQTQGVARKRKGGVRPAPFCSCWMLCRHFSDASRHTDHVTVAIGTVARTRSGRTPRTFRLYIVVDWNGVLSHIDPANGCSLLDECPSICRCQWRVHATWPDERRKRSSAATRVIGSRLC